jgi:N-acyl-D-aspartate/D-glutamate deacylase
MDRMHDFMQSEQIIPGFGDGGAHGSMIQDAVGATHSLTHWVRDRTQGVTGRFPIEVIVKKQTADVAEVFGLTDRGQLTVGMKADLNCFDLAKMKVNEPYMMTDTGPGVELERWTQTVEGYKLTLVSGVATFRDGQSTGAFPGTLARNPARNESAYQGIAWDVSTDFEGFVPDFVDASDNALDGFGDRGGSAAARLLRETIEKEEEKKQAAKL